ncbi:PilZ domain-containing protein [Pseudomonas sp. LAIL14HWK12:I2]|nr:PilZ domain-containing protein [Pseudomonas sp. LAIL14HWK12:I2]SCZ20431.1 PilZ domain-containing protein [Pseudomonas sp. NFIX46]SDB16976.1 PilZ domain-containing protein [Pseudomonas putida]SFQ61324.1 PilZ domain-containing protein [Pseudomonas sp. NFIX49]
MHGDTFMFTDRRIERHQLPYFLRVFNSVTDKPVGFLGNVSEDGLMLISQLPMMIGAEFNLRLKIPLGEGRQQVIDLTACCLWCHEDATPQHYDAGFSLYRTPPEYGQLVEALKQYFSFQPLPASA